MKRNRRTLQSPRRTIAQPAALELSPERAFVLHLDVDARPPRRVAGRVEHIRSGEVAHVTSLAELLAFLAQVLRDHCRSPRTLARRGAKLALTTSATDD